MFFQRDRRPPPVVRDLLWNPPVTRRDLSFAEWMTGAMSKLSSRSAQGDSLIQTAATSEKKKKKTTCLGLVGVAAFEANKPMKSVVGVVLEFVHVEEKRQ